MMSYPDAVIPVTLCMCDQRDNVIDKICHVLWSRLLKINRIWPRMVLDKITSKERKIINIINTRHHAPPPPPLHTVTDILIV